MLYNTSTQCIMSYLQSAHQCQYTRMIIRYCTPFQMPGPCHGPHLVSFSASYPQQYYCLIYSCRTRHTSTIYLSTDREYHGTSVLRSTTNTCMLVFNTSLYQGHTFRFYNARVEEGNAIFIHNSTHLTSLGAFTSQEVDSVISLAASSEQCHS